MEKQEYLTKENINLVIEKIKEGMSGNEIFRNYGISKYAIKKIMEHIKENNPKLYQEIYHKQMQNTEEIKRNAGKKNNIYYGFQKTEKTKRFNPEASVFKNYDFATINEIIQMILTFRPSTKSLAQIFNTTEEDILYFYDTVEKYCSACFNLHYESNNFAVVNQEEDLITFTNTLEYWNSRNRLLNLVEKYPDKENKAIINKRLKNLRREIDDSYFNEAKAKHFRDLTQEEARAVAFIRIKYNLSWEMIDKMGIYREKIRHFEEQEALQDPVFAWRLNFLNDRNNYKKNILLNYNQSKKI